MRSPLTWMMGLALALGLSLQTGLAAEGEFQVPPAPPRNDGEGPYPQLILRSATIINGTGAPAFGPADIVIEGNRIVQVMSVGAPGGAKEDPRRPRLKAGGR